MDFYRGIEYSIWNKHFIKLFDVHGIKRDGRDYLRRGELYISIPPAWKERPDIYARQQIDILYGRMEYHQEFEIRQRLR